MIKLLGNPASTCTRKVLFTLHATNTPFEMQVIDFMKGEHKGAEYMHHQPFGQLPALVDGDFEMFESRAMARYVDEVAGHKLTPTDAKGRAVMEQWISVETSNFTPHAMTFVYNDVFKRPQGEEKLAAAGNALDKCCAILDARLAETKAFLVGDKLTLADVGYAPYIEYAMVSPAAKAIFAKHPHLMAWWNRISETKSWQKAAGRATA